MRASFPQGTIYWDGVSLTIVPDVSKSRPKLACDILADELAKYESITLDVEVPVW